MTLRALTGVFTTDGGLVANSRNPRPAVAGPANCVEVNLKTVHSRSHSVVVVKLLKGMNRPSGTSRFVSSVLTPSRTRGVQRQDLSEN